ncbi:hypothetical protein RRF57_003421 [Xylaria bambusicola]|uniref:Protein PBN1 n=1 Tax=Xylaria bambusicola TaxID=326684 RepID=A0AAN7UK81_9PEZI
MSPAREHRVTLALEELPDDLQELLHEIHELHLRWNTPRARETLGPWTSRLPPGLHVFYTPQAASATNSARLCGQLRAAFGDIDCSSPAYFQPLDTLSNLSKYAELYACGPTDSHCKEWTQALEDVVSLDLSYDAISHAVKITAVWPEGPQKLSISSHPKHRTEVGILTPDSPPHLEPYELGVTGLLTVLDEATKPSPVLFAFPSRHKDAGSKFSSALLQPMGLHPTLQLKFDSSRPPSPESSCSLHAYLTLPRTIFADKRSILLIWRHLTTQ